MKRATLVMALTLLVPQLALASIGKIAVLEGKATRAPQGGAAVDLAVGTEIELKDTLKVGPGGNLKLELNDGSQIALSEKAELYIDDAQFDGQDCKSFLGTLKSGALWTHVKKLLGGAKYEVKTERAVAGVRGTIFRIDADTLVKGAKTKARKPATVIRVVEGVVRVNPSAKIAKTLKGAAPKGGHVEVKGPQEVSADEWEKIFVQLQAGEAQAVGSDLFEAAELDEKLKNDAFSKWLAKQGP